MIPVAPAPEPADFDRKVRQPGLSAIDEMVGRKPRLKRPGPRREKIAAREADIPADKFPPFWREALEDMLERYERRCAYLAMHLHHATGNPTVDHFVPKSSAWDQVYEWANYRLCAGVINSNKGELVSVVAPFKVKQGWFALSLDTCRIGQGPRAPQSQSTRIAATLPILNLRPCVKAREEYLRRYELGPGHRGIDLAYLEDFAPFIASELRRQGRLLRGDT